ncbi:MAG TPA: aminotransferase class V-fold PLP-dependent enzyme [Longimicrobium sp.]|jgi:cysteine desulfurase family protein|uniref:aminotransferase class V-fold PLP-dependent enzyme n=1 Tax=Longimicrobium sp. TaxID=2029185 RepID=UPI002ED8C25B
MDDGAVYLDYAATSAVRPEPVIEAVTDYLRGVGATPGRAGHRRAVDAGRIVFRCRRALAALFNAPGDPGRLTFHLNATHALNVAILGLLRPGDRVVRTAYDHNAVRRPVRALAGRGVHETVLAGQTDGSVDLDEADRALQGARLLVIPHATNVLGTALPVADLAARAHAAGALVLVDAAQSAGHLPIDVQAMGIDLLAFTGHKGLLGPQGTGGLWVRDGLDLPPVFLGGTGGDSDAPDMPALFPDRLEAGSQNGPGIAGLLAGVEWLAERGVATVHAREVELKLRLWDALDLIPGVTLLSPPAEDGVGIVTMNLAGVDAADLARRLDRDFGILVRAGLHCSPEQHDAIGTGAVGAVRFSVGWATTGDEVDRAAAAVARIAGAEPQAARAGS